MYFSETNLSVRYAETDQMGIVHHSNYPVWFEVGRTDFIKKLGLSYSEIESRGLMLPVLELQCKYMGSAKYEDELIIKTSIKEMAGVRLTFSYEVFKKGDSKLITYGETTHAWTDKNLKPVNLKKYNTEIYSMLYSCNQ